MILSPPPFTFDLCIIMQGYSEAPAGSETESDDEDGGNNETLISI